jgi:anti-anti-sigma factor
MYNQAMKRDFVFSQELKISQQTLPGGGLVIQPQGAIDTATTEDFRSRVQKFLEEKAQAPDILLDLSGVKYISSISLGAMIHLLKKSQASNTAFAVYDPQLAVRRVFEISKLDFLLVDPAQVPSAFADYVRVRETAKAAAAPKKI